MIAAGEGEENWGGGHVAVVLSRGAEYGRGGGGAGALGILPATAANGDVAEGAAVGPVSAAGLTEVAGLREVIVVVVAEFCVG